MSTASLTGLAAWLPSGGTSTLFGASGGWEVIQAMCSAMFEEACTERDGFVQMTCEKSRKTVDHIQSTTWAMEAERDGLRIAVSVQANAKLELAHRYSTMNTPGLVSGTGLYSTANTTTSQAPDEKVWSVFEVEILQYDNENKLDVGFILLDPKDVSEKLKDLGLWLDARRQTFGVERSP